MTGSSAERETVEALATYYDRHPTDDEYLAEMRAGAVLYDCLGLYGFPGLVRPNGDIIRMRQRTFNRFVKRGLVRPAPSVPGWQTYVLAVPIDPPPGGRPAARADGEG